MKAEAEQLIRDIALGWVEDPEQAAKDFVEQHEGIDLTTDEGQERFLSEAEAMAEQGYDVKVAR